MPTLLADHMKVRRPPLDFSNLPKYWIANRPFPTHFANVCNVIVPVGEQFFIDAVREFRHDCKNPELKAVLGTFIGQEAWHKQVHEAMWDRIEHHGTPIYKYAKLVTAARNLDRFLSPKMRLSVTAGLEHYTATMSENFFTKDFFNSTLIHKLPPEVYELLMWHGAEELEHKAVVFDLMQEIDDSYWLRVAGFWIGTAFAVTVGLIGLFWFLLVDRDIWRFKRGTQSTSSSSKPRRRSFFPRRLMRLSWRSMRNLLAYNKPSFHPNDVPDPQAVFEYVEELEKRLAS